MLKVTRTQVTEDVTGELTSPPHNMSVEGATQIAERLISRFEEHTIENENSWNGER